MKYLRELFQRLISGESASSILTGLPPMIKGHVGEAILRVLTICGIHPSNPSSFVTPYMINTKDRRLELLSTLQQRLAILQNSSIDSGASGKVDVCWRDGCGISVCTSKIGMILVKALANLEIVPMLAEFTEGGGYRENGKAIPRQSVTAYALVNNSYEVLQLAEKSKASNKASKDNLNPLDLIDLDRMCAILVERIGDYASKDIETILGHLLSDEKPMLRLRFHQRLLRIKPERAIASAKKTILIGALPRSGKTWIAAAIAKFSRVLIITTRPSETSSQWMSVFQSHRDFSKYKVKALDSSSSDEIASMNKNGQKIVAVASIQYFKHEARDALVGLDWDLVILDEIHAGGSTDLSSQMLDLYTSGNAVKLMMTATYTKAVYHYSIPEDCCFFWDMEDARLMRSWGEPGVRERLSEKYGSDDVEAAINETYKAGFTDDSIRECYVNAPSLAIFTTLMQPEIYEGLRQIMDSPDNIYGFSLRALFMTTKDGAAFQNQGAVDTFLALITGSDKMKHYKQGDMSFFERIRQFWKLKCHRNSDEFMTQMWFLPSGPGQLLENVKSALTARIKANSVLKSFATMTFDSGMKDLQKSVSAAVIDAKAQGKKGLIILTGNVGSLGVSLPEVDVGFMLHDIESADMNYQQMMRVLTEMEGKKCGIVVDFNVWRILTTLNTYAASRCGQSDKNSVDRIRWCISHLVDVDPDLWQCKNLSQSASKDSIADQLVKQWQKMLEQTTMTLDSLARKQVDLGEDQKEFDGIAKHLDDASSKLTLEVNSDQEELDSGIDQRSEGSREEKQPAKKDEEEVLKKANLNDVLARLIPALTVLTGKKDLGEALNSLDTNPKHRAAINQLLLQLYS